MKIFRIFVPGFLLLFAAVASAAWAPPPGNPPNCPAGYPGCDAPLNVSAKTQLKDGGLGVAVTGGGFSVGNNEDMKLFVAGQDDGAVQKGNVGVGTRSPTAKLHVVDTHNSTNLRLQVTQKGTAQSGLQLNRSGGTISDWIMYLPSGSEDLRFWSGANKLTLTKTGNLGIGTITPSPYRLNVSGGPAKISAPDDGALVLQTTDNTWLYTDWLDKTGARRAWMGLNGGLDTFHLHVQGATDKIVLSGGQFQVSGAPAKISAPDDSALVLQTTDNTWLYTDWLDKTGARRAWMGLNGGLDTFTLHVQGATNKIALSGGQVQLVNTPQTTSNTRILTVDHNNFVSWRSAGSWAEGGEGGGGGGGTVTKLDQGPGITLTPNPITTTGTISADMNHIIRNFTTKDSCGPGAFMRSISSGYPVCDIPSIPSIFTAAIVKCNAQGLCVQVDGDADIRIEEAARGNGIRMVCNPVGGRNYYALGGGASCITPGDGQMSVLRTSRPRGAFAWEIACISADGIFISEGTRFIQEAQINCVALP